MAARGAFSGRMGFVFAAIGSAVGLGNLWRFPYQASDNGGAVFLLIYVLLLFVIGLPALMAEMSLGRRSGKNAADAFNTDGKTKPWTSVGLLGIATAILLLAYYSVIAGWALRYFLQAFAGAPYLGETVGETESYFLHNVAEGPWAIACHFLFMAVTVFIVSRGVSGGIEKANLVMMPALFLMIVGLALYGNLIVGDAAGRAEGISFYLKPDLEEFTGNGLGHMAAVISDAAGQTFFSIGLGLGIMLTYSSYLDRKQNLQGTGMTIGFADTGVAVLAGFMIFPLMFGLGLADIAQGASDSSVGGLFIAIPTAFAEIGGLLGTSLSALFFLMLTFAALSSAISLLEAPVSAILDRTTWGRGRATLLVGLAVYAIGVPSAFSLGALTFFDELVSKVLLLTGGLLLSIYVGWVRPHFLDELSVGEGMDWSRYFRPVIRYVLPVLLTGLLALGIYDFAGYVRTL